MLGLMNDLLHCDIIWQLSSFELSTYFLLWNSTDSTEQSPSWEAYSRSISQEISHLLFKSVDHYCVHKSPSLVFIVSQMNPVHAFPQYFLKIHCDVILLGLSSGLFTSGFQIKVLHVFLVSSTHATWFARLIPLFDVEIIQFHL
jgi:hypothetical protein